MQTRKGIAPMQTVSTRSGPPHIRSLMPEPTSHQSTGWAAMKSATMARRSPDQQDFGTMPQLAADGSGWRLGGIGYADRPTLRAAPGSSPTGVVSALPAPGSTAAGE